jgi:hypothetical protein
MDRDLGDIVEVYWVWLFVIVMSGGQVVIDFTNVVC